MIQRPIEAITEQDLQLLIDNKVTEDKTIEYKRDLPGNRNDDKIQFLKAVSSFANADGGDLLYGIAAATAEPVEIFSIGAANQDETKLRLEAICRDGLEPRLPKIDFRFITTTKGSVLLIRVQKSWLSPHRVKYSGHGHFYGRHSSGAFQLDVGELRNAFTLSAQISDRIRDFVSGRIGYIYQFDTPVCLAPIRGK